MQKKTINIVKKADSELGVVTKVNREKNFCIICADGTKYSVPLNLTKDNCVEGMPVWIEMGRYQVAAFGKCDMTNTKSEDIAFLNSEWDKIRKQQQENEKIVQREKQLMEQNKQQRELKEQKRRELEEQKRKEQEERSIKLENYKLAYEQYMQKLSKQQELLECVKQPVIHAYAEYIVVDVWGEERAFSASESDYNCYIIRYGNGYVLCHSVAQQMESAYEEVRSYAGRKEFEEQKYTLSDSEIIRLKAEYKSGYRVSVLHLKAATQTAENWFKINRPDTLWVHGIALDYSRAMDDYEKALEEADYVPENVKIVRWHVEDESIDIPVETFGGMELSTAMFGEDMLSACIAKWIRQNCLLHMIGCEEVSIKELTRLLRMAVDHGQGNLLELISTTGFDLVQIQDINRNKLQVCPIDNGLLPDRYEWGIKCELQRGNKNEVRTVRAEIIRQNIYEIGSDKICVKAKIKNKKSYLELGQLLLINDDDSILQDLSAVEDYSQRIQRQVEELFQLEPKHAEDNTEASVLRYKMNNELRISDIRYYRNYCWKKIGYGRCSGHITQRQRRCKICGWYICPVCGNCKPDCQRTNPVKKVEVSKKTYSPDCYDIGAYEDYLEMKEYEGYDYGDDY